MILTSPSFDTVARFNELPKGKILLGIGSLFDKQQKVVSQLIEIGKLASPVQGSNWRITTDNLDVPYEFRLEDKDKLFLEEFSRKLNELDLTNIFGLCAINKDNFLSGIESTEGRKNITVSFMNLIKPDDQIEAVWNFKHSPNKIIERKFSQFCAPSNDGSGRHIDSHRRGV
ncbi:hypothetical protein C1646_774733 [Rhizophagus diaphanus]|nr:hypothetical protein C1646_774733 [Rhizophagus diaphanus] [Rhizophagus sp. MUCL 43196]